MYSFKVHYVWNWSSQQQIMVNNGNQWCDVSYRKVEFLNPEQTLYCNVASFEQASFSNVQSDRVKASYC